MFRIQTFNHINTKGLQEFPAPDFSISENQVDPHALLCRSQDLHTYPLNEALLAIGRAGAGINNIPVSACSERGIPVFNTPGANANAVKELVLTSMLLACRNIYPSLNYVAQLDTKNDLKSAVEQGKKKFVGYELAGRTLGLIGLGAIGTQVANTAIALGMKVIGFDPAISIEQAWQLSSEVKNAQKLEEVLQQSDFISLHVPLLEATQNLLNNQTLTHCKNNAVLLNFSRGEIVDPLAVSAAIRDEKLYAYLCDFPDPNLLKHERIVTLPHLGASTVEAEENCAVMVSQQVRNFLQQGNIRHSVNFPEIDLPRQANAFRLAICNANIPNMVSQITTTLAHAKLNILDMLNKSRDNLAYTLVDVQAPVPNQCLEQIAAVEGIISVRRV